MAKKKSRLRFDKRGGVIVMSRGLLKSENYLSLSAQAKALMTLMHSHWRDVKPVDYGVREAAKTIPCAKRTAQNAFKELQAKGFIEKKDESFFSSRTESRTRTWRITWMPYFGKGPTNEWEVNQVYRSKNRPWLKPPGAKMHLVKNKNVSQGQIVTLAPPKRRFLEGVRVTI